MGLVTVLYVFVKVSSKSVPASTRLEDPSRKGTTRTAKSAPFNPCPSREGPYSTPLIQRVDSLGQYSHKDNLIMTCLKSNHVTLVRIASCNVQYINEDENATDVEMQNLEKQVITFLNTILGACIESSDISVCYLFL